MMKICVRLFLKNPGEFDYFMEGEFDRQCPKCMMNYKYYPKGLGKDKKRKEKVKIRAISSADAYYHRRKDFIGKVFNVEKKHRSCEGFPWMYLKCIDPKTGILTPVFYAVQYTKVKESE